MVGSSQLAGNGPPEASWTRSAIIVVITFPTAVAVLLIYEHHAHIFAASGVLAGILVICVAMHKFMHRHYRGHGGHGDDTAASERPDEKKPDDD